jgi:hypothetical protein
MVNLTISAAAPNPIRRISPVFSEGSDLANIGLFVFESPICNSHDNYFGGATQEGPNCETPRGEKAISNSNDVFTSMSSAQQSLQLLPLPQPPLLTIYTSRLFGPQMQASRLLSRPQLPFRS